MKRNPWPYAVTGFIVLFVVTVIGFGIYSLTLDYHLVSPDYYQKQLEFQDQIDQETRAESLSEKPRWSQARDSGDLVFQFSTQNPPQAGGIMLFRPSDPGQDRTYPVSVDPEGQQVIETSDLASGLWRIKLSWVQQGQTYFLEEHLVLE